jgi:hypothetical protein
MTEDLVLKGLGKTRLELFKKDLDDFMQVTYETGYLSKANDFEAPKPRIAKRSRAKAKVMERVERYLLLLQVYENK